MSRRASAALYRLLIVRCPSGTLRNPVGVTDNKQAVSTPADKTYDIGRNPEGVTGYDESVQPLCAGLPLCVIARNEAIQAASFISGLLRRSSSQ